MTSGFSQRFKGKTDFPLNALWMSGGQGQIVFINSGSPTNGTAGTLANIANIGSLLIDIQTAGGALYQNTGTMASPTWSAAPLTGVAGITSGTIAGVTSIVMASGGFFNESIAVGLAAVGTNRGTALALTDQINVVATAASAAVGVTLPASATVGVGGWVDVYNDGPSNAFHVYAAGSDTIDGTGGSTGVDLTNAFWCRYLLGATGAFTSYRSAIVRSA